MQVTAKQFNWQVTYPGADGKFGTADDKTLLDEMHVPVNKVMHVHLRSQDVIHSFFVPQFRIKQDAVPGREIVQWFEATKPGKYEMPVRRAVRLRPLRHAGLDLRAHARGVREVGGREPRAEAAPAAAPETKAEETKLTPPADAKGGKAKR